MGTLSGHRQRIRWIAWSPDGQMMASGSEDCSIRLWDAATGRACHTLHDHMKIVYCVAWSPNGKTLASASDDNTVRLWDVKNGHHITTLKNPGPVYCVSWSPSGRLLASGCADGTIMLWDLGTKVLRQLTGHKGPVYSLAWSRDGKTLASGSSDCWIRLWDGASGQQRQEKKIHFGPVYSVAWSRDDVLVSGSGDCTIWLWDTKKGKTTRLHEGHADAIRCVIFSYDDYLLASQGYDGTVWLWNHTAAQQLEHLDQELNDKPLSWMAAPLRSLAFHPSSYRLASLCADDTKISLWDLNLDKIPRPHTINYTNAKVVLVGEDKVGKTSLARAMLGHSFEKTSRTHGRHIWPFSTNERKIDNRIVACETLLWDLAGQPGYRVIHQLHLNEAAVALVVFDPSNEEDPFAGVAYWARALDAAAGDPETRGFPLVKFLVSARADLEGAQISPERIKEIRAKYHFDKFFSTSALDSDGITELSDAIYSATVWDKMPKPISTPGLFRDMKQFVIAEKEAGRILQPRGHLLRSFQQSHPAIEASQEIFDTCLRLLEAIGLVRRLTFSNLVLLQPEILDNYCAWLAQAAQAELNGLGFILEADALAGKFQMDAKRMLATGQFSPEVERKVLLATVQEGVSCGIVYREMTEFGTMLVFPSEMRTDMPEYSGDYIGAVAFEFEGPVSAIYATLAVRLINSREFRRQQLYKNAAVLLDRHDRECGFVLDYPDVRNDALGRLIVFFEPDTEKDIKIVLLRYINRQLEKMALQNSVRRDRIYQCLICRYTIPAEAVKRRRERGASTAICPVCEHKLPIDDLVEQITRLDARIDAIEAEVDAEQQRQKRVLVLPERERNREYHVFLCHNRQDRSAVRQLTQRLRDQGILAWIDEHNVLMSRSAAPNAELKQIIDRIPFVAIVLGGHAFGHPHEQEYYHAFLRFQEHRSRSGPPNHPVMLPDMPRESDLLAPVLRNLDGIDFRHPDGLDHREQMHRLIQLILNLNP